MELYTHLLLFLLVIVSFLFSMCGLLHRLKRQYEEHLAVLDRKTRVNAALSNSTEPVPKEIEACVINIENGYMPRDPPPKYDEVEFGSVKNGQIPTVHHI